MKNVNTSFKKNLLLSLVSLLSILSLFFAKDSRKFSVTAFNPPVANPLDSFVIGIMDDAWGANAFSLKDTLKLNTWHKYSSYVSGGWVHSEYNGEPNDLTFADSSVYYNGIKTLIANNYNNKNLKTVMDRPKTSWLAWGQSSDYQCEEDVVDDDYWFILIIRIREVCMITMM
jgi:hypothetical protein